ncbi:hypothetical protein FHT44_005029 [Mycolicibacterium sp. BK634]|nr:hypothetical protein [Mycolicibacterium sp. BK634]
MDLHERDIHDPRIDQARELIRQVLVETLIDGAMEEVGVS